MTKNLQTFFNPKSIAVIGASRSPEKVGSIVLKNIIESKYTGKIYPINPNTDSINNLQCYHDVASIPEIPDLAVIAIPAKFVNETLTQIGEKGIKNVIVFSAGFRETGAEGAKLEKELSDVAAKYQLNLLGPNCLGFVNNQTPVNVTFSQPANRLGNLRFISQSGAIASGIFDWCNSTGLGFSEFITLGNKTALNENDILAHFAEESAPVLSEGDHDGLSNVNPIGLYLESISNGSEFLRIAGEIAKKNPILILKPGKTKAAATAMQSHTGAIAGEDDVLEAALYQSGLIRCKTLEDFFDFTKAFSFENVPAGPKVAIISNAGGLAVISADAVISEGLELAQFDQQTQDELLKALPREASIINPVDVLGDALALRYLSAAEIVLQTNKVDSLLVILTPQVMTEVAKTAEIIGGLSKKYGKPIFCSFMGGSLVAEGEKILNANKIPAFRFPERAIAAIGTMWRWKARQAITAPISTEILTDGTQITAAREIINKARANNLKTLDNLDSNNLIRTAGIATPPTAIVSDFEGAKRFANENGWPVVLKLSSPTLLHKKDVGGVIIDIRNEQLLEQAWDELKRKIDHFEEPVKHNISIQIQKEIIQGVEVIVGIKHDPTFGPVLLFGAGGSFAELILDKNIHLLPINIDQAKELVSLSRIYAVLKGMRGEPPYALDKLYDLILRLARLAQTFPAISQIEINPVIVTLNDVWAVDAKVILKEGETKPVSSPAFHVATTTECKQLSAKVHEFMFETETPFVYKPGQYISVKVATTRINAYSIAGQPDPNHFRLLIDTSPGGPGSKFFEALKTGDKITYLGPFGIFTFKPEDGSKHLLFLSTGSGCSPMRSMIEAALNDPNFQKPMTLYFGLRYPNDIFWQDYFEKLSKEHPNFNFKMILSKPDATWNGPVGHITDLVKSDFPNASDVSAYICGSNAMIDETSNILQSQNCPKEHIYFEKFF